MRAIWSLHTVSEDVAISAKTGYSRLEAIRDYHCGCWKTAICAANAALKAGRAVPRLT